MPFSKCLLSHWLMFQVVVFTAVIASSERNVTTIIPLSRSDFFSFFFFDTKSSAPVKKKQKKNLGSFSLGGGSHKQDEDYAEHRLYGVRCVIDEEELEAGCS